MGEVRCTNWVFATFTTRQRSRPTMMDCGADVMLHPENALSSISVNPSSTSGLIVVREEQPLKAFSLIVSRDGGSSTFDKLSHPPPKVPFSMVFNKGGSLNVVKDLQ